MEAMLVRNLPLQVQTLMSEGVENVSIINESGRIEDTISKNDLNLSKEKKEMFYMGLRLQYAMQREYDSELGSLSYAMMERKNLKFIIIPGISNMILIVMRKTIGHAKIIKKIKKIISNSDIMNNESKS